MNDSFFFYLSKLAWLAINPGAVLFAAVAVGALLLWTRWWQKGRALLLVSITVALVIATVPLGVMLLVSLEQRFVIPNPMPDHVAGIIILSGGVANPVISQAQGRPELGASIDRLTEGASLARQYPAAKVVFTGGSGSILTQHIKEADVLRPTFALLGLGSSRLIVENQSRNTYENAVYSKKLVNPRAGEPWILVTSAFHMPRAVGVFRRAGWQVIPYPVDYGFVGFEAVRPQFSLTKGLGLLSRGLHEWLGLVAYRLTDKTSHLFPAP